MQHFLLPSIMYITYVGIDRKNKWMRIVGAYMLYANLVMFFFSFFVKRILYAEFFIKFISCLLFLFYVHIGLTIESYTKPS